jgi:hypothetical protein
MPKDKVDGIRLRLTNLVSVSTQAAIKPIAYGFPNVWTCHLAILYIYLSVHFE